MTRTALCALSYSTEMIEYVRVFTLCVCVCYLNFTSRSRIPIIHFITTMFIFNISTQSAQ